MDVTETQFFDCDICGNGPMTSEDMKTHMLLEHIEPEVHCPFCDLSGTTPDEMTLHVNTVHMEDIKGSPGPNTNKASASKASVVPGEKSPSSKENANKNGTRQKGPKTKRKLLPSDDNNQQIDHFFKPSSTQWSHKNSDKTRREGSCSNEKSAVDMDCSTTSGCSLFSDISSPGKGRGLQNDSVDMFSDGENDAKNLKDISISEGNLEYQGYQIIVTCPMCSFASDCSETMTVHVNQAHFQDTPSKLPNQEAMGASDNAFINGMDDTDIEKVPTAMSGEESCSGTELLNAIIRTPSKEGKTACPHCDKEFEEGLSLQFHINGSHSEETRDTVPLVEPESAVPVCPVCLKEFPNAESAVLEAHVNSHFTGNPNTNQPAANSLVTQEEERRKLQAKKFQEEKEFKKLKEEYGIYEHDDKGSYKQQALKNLEKSVSKGQMSITDFYTTKQNIIHANKTGIDEGTSCTKGVLTKVEQYYSQQKSRCLSRHWLASAADHYGGSYGDRGWGCGYRNFQMLLSCLVTNPIYQQTVFNGNLKIPSIPKIQRLIEAAWAKGFDPQGREQLKSVVDTSKWIGATEICATLASLKVKYQLVDFHSPTGKDGTHPMLFQWVKKFYSQRTDFRPPLYLQHQGHSRTIVGLEEYKDGSMKLLIFDPGTAMTEIRKFTRGDVDNNKMKIIRRTLYGLKAKQYQIVAVTGILTDAEQQRSKLLRSERVP